MNQGPLVTPQLNHLIVWSTDRRAAATTFADVMGMEPPTDLGHFAQVEAGNGVLLDFADTRGEPSGMHLAFLVTEREFDEIFDRITERAMPHWADPRRSVPDRINHHDGGRGRPRRQPRQPPPMALTASAKPLHLECLIPGSAPAADPPDVLIRPEGAEFRTGSRFEFPVPTPTT